MEVRLRGSPTPTPNSNPNPNPKPKPKPNPNPNPNPNANANANPNSNPHQVLPGAVELSCEDDLWRHYAREKAWMRHYLLTLTGFCFFNLTAITGGP